MIQSRCLSRALTLSAIVLLALALLADRPAPGQGPRAAEIKAEAALARLRERLADRPSADLPKLRKELVALRLTCPGTPTDTQIAATLSQVPSPLDRLQASTIAPLEKFNWQPKELVGVLGEHRGRHAASVSCVAVSPDSSLIASGGANLVRLWSPTNMRLQARLGHYYGVTSISFSKDSKSFAVGGGYGRVDVWDVVKDASPKLRFTINAGSSVVYSVSFHPNNKVVAVGGHDNSVRLYDVSGKAVKSLVEVTTHKQPVTAVAFSPDGKTLASGSSDMTVKLWSFDGADIKERSVLEGHSAGITSLAFSPSGKTLASGCSDGTMRLWTMPAGPRPKPHAAHQGPKGAVTAMSFSKSGMTLAAACGDNTARLWAVGSRFKERGRLEGHAGVVRGVAYSPDMKLLVTGGEDWMVRTWDLTKTRPTERFVPWSHLSAAYSVAFSPDSHTLVSGSQDRVVRFWDLDRPAPRTRNYLKFEVSPVYTVAYSPDGKRVAAGGAHTTVKQWDAIGGKTRASLAGHPSHVFALAYTPDGTHILTGSHKELLLFDAVKGAEVRRFPAHETLLTCMALTPNGRYALSGSGTYLYDKQGRIMYKKGQPLYNDCVLRRWDLESGAEAHTIKDNTRPFSCAVFSADSRQLYAGPVLRRWNVKEKASDEVAVWKGLDPYANQMAATPDGKALVIRSSDGLVTVWEIASGKRLFQWTFHESIGQIAVSAECRHVAVGLTTGVVYVLRLGPPTVGAK
jgi:WD40 repeat protein